MNWLWDMFVCFRLGYRSPQFSGKIIAFWNLQIESKLKKL
jgi:hypothetical protein